jgi:hypothetical protein
VQPLWKKIWRLLKNLNVELLYDPAVPLLGIYPKECNIGYSKGTYTPMFTALAIHNSQVMETTKMPPLLMDGSRKYGIYTQWNFTQL